LKLLPGTAAIGWFSTKAVRSGLSYIFMIDSSGVYAFSTHSMPDVMSSRL
jgi:hypothetical protein